MPNRPHRPGKKRRYQRVARHVLFGKECRHCRKGPAGKFSPDGECPANRPSDPDSDRPPCLIEVDDVELEAVRWFNYLHKPGMGGLEPLYDAATGLEIPQVFLTFFSWVLSMIQDYKDKTKGK